MTKSVFPLKGFVLWIALCGLLISRVAEAGTWTPLANAQPLGTSIAELMSDGTMLLLDGGGNCAKLTPDIHGSYVNGTWAIVQPMNYSRWNFGVAMLTNAQLLVVGGEYGGGIAPGQYWNGTSIVQGNGQTGEVYDPTSNLWTPRNPNLLLGDCLTELLPNGDLIVSPANNSGLCALYDAVSNVWEYQTIPAAASGWDECSWVKLPNGCIFGVDDAGLGEHYVPSLKKWILDGASPLPGGGGENTPFLMSDGRVIYIGQVKNTAFYTSGGSPTAAGAWQNGPNLPMVGTNQLVAGGEGGGIMMANGNVLLELFAPNGAGYLYEYNSKSNLFTAAPANPSGGYTLDLPDGTVYENGGYIYTPSDRAPDSVQPVINTLTQNSDGSYHLSGTGLTGFSEGAASIDDGQAPGNFPLVRMTNHTSGNVYYARTYNWSSGGVQTGSQVLTTEFSLLANLPAGTYSLVVVALGNASAPRSFTYAPPAAPTRLKGTAGDAQAVLSWNPVSGATTYNVKRLTGIGTPHFATVATVTGTNYTDTGLINATSYFYAVSAVGTGGESANSASIFLTPSGAPPIPTGVTASADTFARIDLSWTASHGAKSYTVKRAATSGGPYTVIASPVNPFYTDTGLASGKAYYYVVSATSDEGESPNSTPVSATAQAVADFGFETPNIGSGTFAFAYNPSGGFWMFDGASPSGSGLIGNGSAFNNPNAPEGVQAAYVQSYGSISQTLSGFVPGTTYQIRYYAAQRPGYSQTWNVKMDDWVIQTNTAGSASYTLYTATFVATVATHTLSFVGTDLAGGDNTVFIDDVTITPPLQPIAPLLTVTVPTNNAIFNLPTPITLTASVATNGNVISNVQFYENATNLIGKASGSSNSYNWINPVAGIYNVFARVTYNGGSVIDSPATHITVVNSNVNFGFEVPNLGSGINAFAYAPSGASWVFGGSSGNGSGIVANGSAFSNPNAPQGSQAAFLQGYSFIAQTFTGFTPSLTYTITFSAAQRSTVQNGGESWNVTVDDIVITNSNPGGANYAPYTVSFTATAPTHTLAFVGTDLAGGDNTVFLDNVKIVPPIPPVVPLVTLSSPANNSAYTAPATFTLAATVTAKGNLINGVKFYVNSTNLIGFSTNAPYNYTWTNASAGSYDVVAEVDYNNSSMVTSSVVKITVTNAPAITQVIKLEAGGQSLSISGVGLANFPYHLDAATNLTPPVAWLTILTNVSDASGNITFTNLATGNAQQFFRISSP